MNMTNTLILGGCGIFAFLVAWILGKWLIPWLHKLKFGQTILEDGPTWHNWVDYWMPFTRGGCGLHDANWRSRFGGEIYKTNGSHGCVNLPHDKAEELFNMISIGTVVIVHKD